jgi:hypothetical protein
MYVRTPNAAIPVDTSNDNELTNQANLSPPFRSRVTLWAERPLQVRAGRLLGVRLTGQRLQVALVANKTGVLTWVQPSSVLSDAQAETWVKSTRFKP